MAHPAVSESRPEITPARWLSIIGIGEDGLDGLSPAARRFISEAELVVGGARHLALADGAIRGKHLAWPSPLHQAFPEIVRRRGRSVAVLASGDPFHYGVGKQLAELVSADEIICLPQPSAFSLAAARMGWPLPEVACISLHGRALAGIVRYLQPGARILALSWDATTPARLAELLVGRGFGESALTVLEAMGGHRERVRSGRADGFDLEGIDPLNTIALEVIAGPSSRIIPLAPGLEDALFESDGQLTKREIRAMTLSALAPRQGELLWDVGLGAGSVAIEWMLCHPSLRAIGIEQRPDRAARALRNAAALGAPELQVVTGSAPSALSGLSAPDAVFIGGGLGDAGVLDAVWNRLKPAGRLVANAITIETEARLAAAYKTFGGELTRVHIARADNLGSMSGWRAARPVTQWRVSKP
jgi:precorrin-6B C5,15-methyltransferase / cobalt-precorrin-6B C5,C15-methyltransferase